MEDKSNTKVCGQKVISLNKDCELCGKDIIIQLPRSIERRKKTRFCSPVCQKNAQRVGCIKFAYLKPKGKWT